MLHAIRLLQARAVSPISAYALALLLGRPSVGKYESRRTGQTIFLRPRTDLHVTRELVVNDIYSPPDEVALALGARPNLSVLDLGANIGLFTLNVFHRWGGGVTVTAVEPDPANIELLYRNVHVNGHAGRVKVLEAAVGTADASAEFAGGLAELSQLSHLANERARRQRHDRFTVGVVDFFPLARGHDFIKIDIEGAEWGILQDPRLRELEAVVLVLEWHLEGAGTSDCASEADRLLRIAGFEEIRHLSPVGTELDGLPPTGPPAGGLWAWRRQTGRPAAASSPDVQEQARSSSPRRAGPRGRPAPGRQPRGDRG